MSSDSQRAPSIGKDSYTTRLTAAEKGTGAGSRWIAFRLLLGVSLVACGAAVYCWYLWSVTARACVQTYIYKQESMLLAAETWQDYFSGLDISSFSALILAFFFTRLAYTGIRNTLWKRRKDGKAYYDHAYDAVLFPEHFELLCIRFGLLGTLLSFLLAAISQMSNRGADKLADNMFLLLCASLVSTFVGTLVAYVALPPLNWLNDRATGIHQKGLTDEESTTEEFFRQLDRTSQRLAEFESATTALSGAATGVIQFQTAAAEGSEDFRKMAHLLTKVTELLGASNKSTDDLAERMQDYEKRSGQVVRQIHDFARELKKPLDRMFRAADAVQKSALAGGNTHQELRLMAKAVRDPLEKITSSSHVTWQLLREVRDSLSLLASSEEQQTTRISAVADLFAGLTTLLSRFLEKADSFLMDQQTDPSGDRDMRAAVLAMRQQLSEITGQVSELKSMTPKSQNTPRKAPEHRVLPAPATGSPSRTKPARSLWRWLFPRRRSSDGNGPFPEDPRQRTGKPRSADKDTSS